MEDAGEAAQDGSDGAALLPPLPPPLDPPFIWNGCQFSSSSALTQVLRKRVDGEELARAHAAFDARDKTPERQEMRRARDRYLNRQREQHRHTTRTERRHNSEADADAHRGARAFVSVLPSRRRPPRRQTRRLAHLPRPRPAEREADRHQANRELLQAGDPRAVAAANTNRGAPSSPAPPAVARAV